MAPQFNIWRIPNVQKITKNKWIAENITQNDHLLIYYAGHGEMLEDEAEGFGSLLTLIQMMIQIDSNSYIKTKLKVAKANNIFLIVDLVFRAPSLAVFLSTKKLMISLLLNVSKN